MEYEYIIIGCGILAVLYGAVTSKSILSLSAGNERMQEIAAAIQEGATAYLNRQYMTISLVGVVVAIILGLALSWTSAIGFVIGAVLSGAAGYIGSSPCAPMFARLKPLAKAWLRVFRFPSNPAL